MSEESAKPRVQPPFWRMMLWRALAIVVLVWIASLRPAESSRGPIAAMPAGAYITIAVIVADAIWVTFRRLRRTGPPPVAHTNDL